MHETKSDPSVTGRTRRSSSARGKPADRPEPFSAAELRGISEEISARGYAPLDATRVELMEVDPWNVHASWHVHSADQAAGRASLPDAGRDSELVLRFSDVSPRANGAAGPHAPFDVVLGEDDNSRYVNLWRDAKRYSAELGLRAPDGAFVPLARSNEIVTPRAGPSPQLDFSQVEVRTPGMPDLNGAEGGTMPSEALLRNLFPQRLPIPDEYPLAIAGSPAGGAEFTVPFGETVMESQADAPEEVSSSADADFPSVEAADIRRYSARARTAENKALAVAKPLPLPAEETVAAAGDATRPGAEPETVTSGMPVMHSVLESALGKSVFSPATGDSAVEVAASVVIEGQAAPGMPLSLFGEPVPLRPDGRFDLKLPLACGSDLVALLCHLREIGR